MAETAVLHDGGRGMLAALVKLSGAAWPAVVGTVVAVVAWRDIHRH